MPQGPSFTAAEIATRFQALLPEGPIWPRDTGAVQSQVMAAISGAAVDLCGRAANLLQDAFPTTTVELLPEWQETLGLPDPCAGTTPTLTQEQAQVAARFTSSGGQSVGFFIAFAATLGYAITITQFKPFRFGETFGLPLYGLPWAYTWQVSAPAVTLTYLKFGQTFGQPFAEAGNSVLHCEIQRLAPAHTTVLFTN